MRRFFVLLLLGACFGLAWPTPSQAGPIRLGVEPAEAVSGPALVRVNGHYVSIHNGNSRHWKDALVPIGGRHFVGLGPVNALLNVGVSVRIVHPEFVSDSQRSHSTPLLIRPVGFETFVPRTWRSVIASGESSFGARPDTPAGHVLSQAYWHLYTILEEYLPAVDAEIDAPTTDEILLAQFELLEQIVRYAIDAPPPSVTRTRHMTPEQYASYTKSLEKHDLENRVNIEDVLHRLREWLSLDRKQRRHIRGLMAEMRHPRQVANQLMTDADRTRMGDYILEVETRRAKKQTYHKATSWVEPSTGIAYRVRMLKPYGNCARLSVSTDLTGLARADLGEMIHSVEGRFCRDEGGQSRYGRS